jgi:hypothetical protein
MDKELQICPSCKTNEHPKSTNKGYLCKPCASKRVKEWQKNNPERFFFNQIRSKYGISREDYISMEEAQNNKCAICLETETAPNIWKEGEYRRLALDHNHKTGEIRGLLCYRCNTTLGKIDDNIELLEKMVTYLKETNGSRT